MTPHSMPSGGVALRLAADPHAVRVGLRQLLAAPALHGVPDDLMSSAEIVLAEVLNNIVEHAYAGAGGVIVVRLDFAYPTLRVAISDDGRPMPDNKLPTGAAAKFSGIADLPEGGFGWFLIRTMTTQLDYRRKAGRNLLSFQMRAD